MFGGEIRLSGGLLKISINPAACGANPARFTRTRERGLPSRVSIRQRRSLSLLPREGEGGGRRCIRDEGFARRRRCDLRSRVLSRSFGRKFSSLMDADLRPRNVTHGKRTAGNNKPSSYRSEGDRIIIHISARIRADTLQCTFRLRFW